MYIDDISALQILLSLYLIINFLFGLFSGLLSFTIGYIVNLIYDADCLNDVSVTGKILATIIFCLIMLPGVVLSSIIFAIEIIGMLLFQLFVKVFKSKEAKERDKYYVNSGDIIN